MSLEDRLVEALSMFDRVEPSEDLFARVEASLERDRAHRRRVRRFAVAGITGAVSVGALLWIATDRASGTINGWAVLVAEFVLLATTVIVLGRTIPRFGRIYVSDVFRLDSTTAARFLRLQDVAYHLVFGGYVIGWLWHPRMAGSVDVSEGIRFLLDRMGGLLLLMGVLHAATLMALPVIGLVHGTIVRDHARSTLGDPALPPDPRAEEAARVARWIVWVIAAIVVIQLLVGVGVGVGIGIGDS